MHSSHTELDFVHIYLPIAEMTVPIENIFLLGIFVGFISGVFGVGGGFLTTPLLIFMGIPSPVAVGTQSCQLVASGLSGVMGHWRKGNVDFRIGMVMLGGGILGSFFGIIFFQLLRYFGQIDLVISILYIVLLGSISTMMLFESMFSSMRKKKSVRSEFNRLRSPPWIARLPYKMRFARSKLYISVFVPGGIGFVSGFLVSVMGVGGGFLLVPAMIYILGMPTLLVAGTSLFQIMLISAFTAIMHAVFNQTIDLLLAAFLIAGGVLGVQAGVVVSRKLTGSKSRIILALMVLTVCIQLAIQLFLSPSSLFEIVIK